jgi:hypothetical protein
MEGITQWVTRNLARFALVQLATSRRVPGATVTSDAGLLLLRDGGDEEEARGLLQRPAAPRIQPVYADCNDAARLVHDPIRSWPPVALAARI